MSFAYQLKNEICQNRPFRQRTKNALAYGLLLFGKCFGAQGITLHTEHRAVARLYADSITDLVGLSGSITMREVRRQERRSIFLVTVDQPSDRDAVLAYFGHAADAEPCIDLTRLTEVEYPAFLAGVFLACGGISDPEKGYHLDFVTPEKTLCDQLEAFLRANLAAPKATVRRNDYILYYKESEHIEELLTYIGAPKATLELMEVKIVKEVRNRVNRETNCETANIEKTVNAALAQVMAIEAIAAKRGLSALDEDLQELARLRLENPDMSLRELGEALSTPISRSGVNHRLRRILDFADTLGK